MVRDLSKEAYVRESTVYRFRNQLQIGRETARRLVRRPGKLGLQAKWAENEPLSIALEVPDEQNVLELAVVMGPLLRPDSTIHFSRILELVEGSKKDEILQDFEKTESRVRAGGAFGLQINEKEIGADRAFLDVLNNLIEAGDVEAAKARERWAREGSLEILLFRCYNYGLDMCKALLILDQKIRVNNAYPAPVARDHICIYCKSTTGPFRFWEHTLPESAGNQQSVLPIGYSCDPCNAMMAPVEQAALRQMPFALARILFLRHTKQGKFPEAKFPNVHMKKTKPNHLVLTGQAGKKSFPKTRENDDGTISFSVEARSKFDHIVLARVLLKGILGAMALENGRDYVLLDRLDAAREFVQSGRGLRSRMFIFRNSKPSAGMGLRWWDRTALSNGALLTAAEVNVFGVRILIGVSPGDHDDELPGAVLDQVEAWNLWDVKPGPHHGPSRKSA